MPATHLSLAHGALVGAIGDAACRCGIALVAAHGARVPAIVGLLADEEEAGAASADAHGALVAGMTDVAVFGAGFVGATVV